ncbi:MAG: pyrroloquinoline-quinone synthase [Solirubrobacterales bacterium]|nr:pyrroloquinoline-quinone synthase [Solirubrobacterales bacterium]MDX6662202.1 pyrroloquinoline-quinone synthase [Solirubrobacterales bacterium]
MSDSIWTRIEQARSRWNVLEHPFYQRWSAGELTRDELARYSGQYRHATAAIAELSASVAEAAPEREREALRRHAAEEADHVRLWDGFVDSVGGSSDAEANRETAECVEAWTCDDGVLPGLVRLYAIESGQPEIARVKAEGLIERYDVQEGPATEYFRLHQKLDVEHAAEARALIDELAGEDDADRLVEAAESAFRANWRLLDGV